MRFITNLNRPRILKATPTTVGMLSKKDPTVGYVLSSFRLNMSATKTRMVWVPTTEHATRLR